MSGMRWDRLRGTMWAPPRSEPPKRQVEPEISQSAVAVKIEERMRRRLGPMPNIKGDRPPEIEDEVA